MSNAVFQEILKSIYLVSGILFLLNLSTSSYLRNSENRKKHFRYFVVTCLAYSFYSFIMYFSLLEFRNRSYDLYLIHLLPLLAFFGYWGYLKFVSEFIQAQSKWLNVYRYYLLFAMGIFAVDLLMSVFFNSVLYYEAFPQSSVSKFIQIARPQFLYNDLAKSVVVTVALFSFIAQGFFARRLLQIGLKKEWFLFFGVMFTSLATINDSLIARNIFVYTFPLLPISFLIEVFRIKFFYISDYSRQLADLDDELQQSSKLAQYAQSTGSIAHDIRNPINVAIGYIKRLGSNKVKLTSIEREKNISKVLKSLYRVEDIIKMHLNFARDVYNDKRELHSLGDIYLAVLDLIEQKISGAGLKGKISFLSQNDYLVNAYTTDVEIILMNLLSNSCESIGKQEEPWIRIRAVEQDGYLRLEIMDSGPGFSGKDREKIFKKGSSSKKGKGGSAGLGLNIVQRLCERNNMQIDILEGRENAGFVITVNDYQNNEAA